MDLSLILSGLVEKYPVIVSILLGIGVARAVFKPLVAMIRAFVSATATKSDDVFLDKVEASPFYKGFLFILDWLVSIKLPGAK